MHGKKEQLDEKATVRFETMPGLQGQVDWAFFEDHLVLEDFDFSFQPSIDKRQLDELATMRFVENAENVVFLGPPGVGKTHLANALGMVAAKNRYSTYCIICHTLMEQLKKSHYENRLPDKLKILVRYKVLIIDEIGYLPMDIQGANLFFQLIAIEKGSPRHGISKKNRKQRAAMGH